MIINCKKNNGFYWKRDTTCNNYFDDVKRVTSILSKEEEHSLIETAQKGTTEAERIAARNKLVEANLRFVISIVRKIGKPENFADLINEGNMGLMRAIETYDLKRDVKLTTYAVSWIISYIQLYQTYVEPSVPMPCGLLTSLYTKNVRKEFYLKEEREPTAEEIIDLVKQKFKHNIKSKNEVDNAKLLSIDEDYNSNSDDAFTFGETQEYTSHTSTNNINDEINSSHRQELIKNILSTLTEREQKVITMRLGFNGYEESFDTIGEELNLCGESCRVIFVNAIKKLKNNKNFKNYTW